MECNLIFEFALKKIYSDSLNRHVGLHLLKLFTWLSSWIRTVSLLWKLIYQELVFLEESCGNCYKIYSSNRKMLDRSKVFCEYKESLTISPSYDRRISKTLFRLDNPFSSFLLGPDYPMGRLVGPLHQFEEMSSPFFLTPKI